LREVARANAKAYGCGRNETYRGCSLALGVCRRWLIKILVFQNPFGNSAQKQFMTTRSLYLDGEYLVKNPGWHVGESAWKAKQVLRMLRQNHISPATVCDVGCGVGEVLVQLQQKLGGDPTLWGYDISPQAIELAKARANKRLHFCLADFTAVQDVHF